MTLLRRQLVCDRLRLQRRASYRIIGSARLSLVSSDDVLCICNNARRGAIDALLDIPTDLLTPDEMAAEIGVEAKALLAWTRRTKNIPPHFRFNKQTTRFSRSRLMAWLGRKEAVA